MGSLQAYTKELLADADTPVSAYVKLCQGEETSFLFESGEGVDSVGRYSIVAWEPVSTLRLEHGQTLVEHGGEKYERPDSEFFAAAQEAERRPGRGGAARAALCRLVHGLRGL